MVAAGAADPVEVLDGLPQAVEGDVVVEVARHEPEALGELLPDLLAELGAGVLLDRVVHDLGEVLVGPVAAGEADQREARRQQAAVGQVVDRRHQLLAGQVAGDAEDAPGRTGPAIRGSRRSCGSRSGLATVPRARSTGSLQRRPHGRDARRRGRSGAAAAPGGRGRRAPGVAGGLGRDQRAEA